MHIKIKFTTAAQNCLKNIKLYAPFVGESTFCYTNKTHVCLSLNSKELGGLSFLKFSSSSDRVGGNKLDDSAGILPRESPIWPDSQFNIHFNRSVSQNW